MPSLPTHIETITDGSRLEALAAPLARLHRRCRAATPFQHPAWLIAWWRHLGHGQLLSFAAWNGDELAGFAPCFVYVHPQGTRRLLLIGTSVTDRMDWLAQSEGEEQVAEALWQAVLSADFDWDVFDFQDLTPSSVLLAHPRPGSITEPHDVCLRKHLKGTWEEMVAALPHGLRRNLTRYRRALETQGELRFAVSEPWEAAARIEELIALHQARWTSAGDTGMFADPRVCCFHREAFPAMHQAGQAAMYSLQLGERRLALLYALHSPEGTHGYLTGFDMAYASSSPMTILLAESMRYAHSQSSPVWDFLRGQEPYKLQWGGEASQTYRLLSTDFK